MRVHTIKMETANKELYIVRIVEVESSFKVTFQQPTKSETLEFPTLQAAVSKAVEFFGFHRAIYIKE